MATTIPDGTWTDSHRDKVINHGKSGGKLTEQQKTQLKESVRVGNKGAEAQEALDNAAN